MFKFARPRPLTQRCPPRRPATTTTSRRPRVSQGVADFQAKIDSGQIGTSEDTRTGREHVAAAHSAVTENAQELVKSIKA